MGFLIIRAKEKNCPEEGEPGKGPEIRLDKSFTRVGVGQVGKEQEMRNQSEEQRWKVMHQAQTMGRSVCV